MPYVYIYIDKNDHKANYVGIVKNAARLMRRIVEHDKDDNLSYKDNYLHYIYTETLAEADTLETDLINRMSPRLNQAKKGWGINSLLDTDKILNLKEFEIDENTLDMIFGSCPFNSNYKRLITDEVLLGSPIQF